jgi:hypothetical protein
MKTLNIVRIENFNMSTYAGMKSINFLRWDWDCAVNVTKDTMTSEIG